MVKNKTYRNRCANCVCLVERGGRWFCDEADNFCEETEVCPEENPYDEPSDADPLQTEREEKINGKYYL